MSRFRYVVFTLVQFVASAFFAHAQSDSREAVIRQVDELRRSILEKQDHAAFQRLVTPDFVFVHSTGNMDDARKFLEYRERLIIEKRWEEEPPAYRVLGDTVVRTGFSGNRVAGRGDDLYRGVDVYVRQGGLWRWALHQTTRVPRKPRNVSVKDALLSEYVGRFVSGEGTQYAVSKEGGGLVLEGQRGRTPYQPQSESTFNAHPLPVNIVFLRDASGRVTRMEMHRREAVTVFDRAATQ